MSDTYRCSWKEVYQMMITEFFNVLSYRVEKDRRQEEAFKNWERKMKKK